MKPGCLPNMHPQLCVCACSRHRSVYEHPRFYCVEVEEHHHMEGPELANATMIFAQGAALCTHVCEAVLEFTSSLSVTVHCASV